MLNQQARIGLSMQLGVDCTANSSPVVNLIWDSACANMLSANEYREIKSNEGDRQLRNMKSKQTKNFPHLRTPSVFPVNATIKICSFCPAL